MIEGSSPLSRGIPSARRHPRAGTRIIPALAGNTHRCSLWCWVCWDHPRSRGEYYLPDEFSVFNNGSSPLSRGIRRLGQVSHRHGRIIPALAGNTPYLRSKSGVAKDHPRSRGEYCNRKLHSLECSGSSPLSRGIPSMGGSSSTCGGIIPALAGNTSARVPQPGQLTDHPRSRGEYWYPRAFPGPRKGSSPLSRGILRSHELWRVPTGIIPALAGNTGCPTRQAHPRGDHPRSRGEYPFTGVGHLPYTGSSPLSRGIPSPYNIIGVFDRIIPALAGNTASARWGRRPRRDHPRSRGEYPPEEVDGQPVRGSSPLSRGILSAE